MALSSHSVCPVCRKARLSPFMTNGVNNPVVPLFAPVQPNLTGDGIAVGGRETLLSGFCAGTGECASKRCPTCDWFIPAGDVHDCARLAGIVGKRGTISHKDIVQKYRALLERTRAEALQLEQDYKLSDDEDGQPHAPWLANATAAIKQAVDEAARVMWE